MFRTNGYFGPRRPGRRLILFAVLAMTLFCGTGADCEEAAATFRQEATSDIGEGIRSIMNGILDGAIAAVEGAGDDDDTADSE